MRFTSHQQEQRRSKAEFKCPPVGTSALWENLGY